MKCSSIYLCVSMDYGVWVFQWTMGFGCFNELLGLCVSKDYGGWVYQWTMGFRRFNRLWNFGCFNGL